MPNATEFAGFLDGLRTQWDGVGQASAGVGDFVFFKLLSDYLDRQILELTDGLLQRAMTWVGLVALSLLTLWILLIGYRIVTGTYRGTMSWLVTDVSKKVVIVSVATSMAFFGTDLRTFFTVDVDRTVNELVTGQTTSTPETIDKNLAYTQVALSAIDAVEIVGASPELRAEKERALLFAGFGTSSPAMTAGAMLTFFKFMIGFFVGLGPLFILLLLFQSTQFLFQRWLQFGIATTFAMAGLNAVTSIVLDLSVRVAAALWGAKAINGILGVDSEGLSALALQQGGIGLLLSTAIVSVPPVLAAFFGGVAGSFTPFSQFAAGGAGTRRNASSSASPAPLTSAREIDPTVDYAQRMLPTQAVQADEIKRLATPDSADGSFTQRYPDALASNALVGGGDPLPPNLHPIAREALPPAVDVALVGLHNGSERQRVLQDQVFVSAVFDSSKRSPSDVLRAQQIVREAGYSLMTKSFERNPAHPDGVTGSWGQETAGALRAYLDETPENILRRKDTVEQMTSHLDIPANPRSSATSTYIEQDGRRYNFTFAANSYANALDYGYTAHDAVLNVDVGTYLAAVDAAARISDAGTDVGFSVSSGWRPNVGSGTHPNGVGLDFTRVQVVQDGREISATFLDPGKRVGHDPSVPEPPLAQQYRESLYAIREQAGIRQIFTPWQMLHSPQGQFRTNHPNLPNDNDWIHRHHLHIGLKVY